MKIDLMRRIDHFAGVPLCFLATGLRRLADRLGSKSRQKPKNVLFLELSEMGSTVLADPAMKKVASRFGATIYFAIFARNKPGLLLSKAVIEENIYVIRDDSFNTLVVDAIRFLIWARVRKIDTVFDLELFSRFTALLTSLSGASNRIGFHAYHNEGLYRGDLLTHKVAYNPHIHISKNFMAMVNALAAPVPEEPYSKTIITDDDVSIAKVAPGDEEITAVRTAIQSVFDAFDENKNRVVLVNPNASQMLPQRRWAADRYVDLIGRVLAKQEDVVILLTGAPVEREEAEELVIAVGDRRCINFAGNIEFEHLTALYSLSTLMVTNDSGPGHFASLTDMPVVVLFGPETPDLYKPLGRTTAIYAGLACSPCVSAANHRKTSCRDNRCMSAITVDQVMEAVDRIL